MLLTGWLSVSWLPCNLEMVPEPEDTAPWCFLSFAGGASKVEGQKEKAVKDLPVAVKQRRRVSSSSFRTLLCPQPCPQFETRLVDSGTSASARSFGATPPARQDPQYWTGSSTIHMCGWLFWLQYLLASPFFPMRAIGSFRAAKRRDGDVREDAEQMHVSCGLSGSCTEKLL